jgi:hypothetical protein
LLTSLLASYNIPMTHGSPLSFEDKVFTVAEYIEILNTFFKAQAVKITGEICELKRAASGHVYFIYRAVELLEYCCAYPRT